MNNPVSVFDSGVGSLSIIRELKKEIPHENLLYFADKAHFPYGNKSYTELREIIVNTVKYLGRFKPKLIIIASNTPSIQVLDEVKRIANIPIPLLGVRPPLKMACRLTKRKHIGIMATQGTIMSKGLEDQIRREIPQDILVTKFNASSIIELVENGTYITNERRTYDTISRVLGNELDRKIDVITLSSTHLPFVKRYLSNLLPTVKFVDPATILARDVRKFLAFNRILKKTGTGRLQIFVSEGKRYFEQTIRMMGVKEPVEEAHLNY
jgi:glutamate racemase